MKEQEASSSGVHKTNACELDKSYMRIERDVEIRATQHMDANQRRGLYFKNGLRLFFPLLAAKLTVAFQASKDISNIWCTEICSISPLKDIFLI